MKNAASVIHDVAGSAILLTMGGVRIFTRQEIPYYIEPEQQYRASVVEMNLVEPVKGKVMLVFSADRAAKLALLLLDDRTNVTDMDAIRNSVFLEIGNIVLNSIVESLNTSFGGIQCRVPTYFESVSDELLSFSDQTEDFALVMGEMCSSIESQYKICGGIYLVLPIPVIGVIRNTSFQQQQDVQVL